MLTCATGSAFQQRYSRPAFMAPAAGKAVIGSNIPTFADRYRGDFNQRMPLYLLQFFFTSISAGNTFFLLPTTARYYLLLTTYY